MTPPVLKLLMTPFPYAVDLGSPLAKAQELMETHRFHHLPVTRDHQPVGLVTDREITLARAAAERAGDMRELQVRDVYLPEVSVVDINTPLAEVLQVMAQRHRDAVIVTRKGRLAGVLTGMDVCRYFAAYLRDKYPRPGGGDAA